MTSWLFSFFALVASSPVAAGDDYLFSLKIQVRAQELATKPQWIKLGHYRKSLWGGYKSEADGPGFFLSPDGRRDPEAELLATLEGFFSTKEFPPDDKAGQHPQCQFPARYLWLRSALNFDDKRLPRRKCVRFERFRDAVDAKSVTVVFSSYFLNNPASAFGHSLLRLNKAPSAIGGKRYELLDYGISYAATVTTGNPILYAVNGIFGGFHGEFTSIPYYYKVREYNDFESRDLWEYDLNLDERQTAMLVAHLWELGATYFDYYYIDENCSYHVLGILEAGNPELNLLDKLPTLVIPADTIRVLAESPGLVKRIHYRPSVRVQFQHRVASLNAREREALGELTRAPGARMPEGLSHEEKIHALDGAIDYMDFRHHKELLLPESEASRWKQNLLLARSRILKPSREVVIPTPERETPHIGHKSARLGLDYGYATGLESGFLRLNTRLALHDLLDPLPGYPEYSHIEFLATRLRYNLEPKSFWLEDLGAFRVTSLAPFGAYSRQLSWKVSVGARTIRDRTCHECLAGNALVGGGTAFSLSGIGASLISLLETELTGSGDFDRGPVRLGAGPSLMLRIPFTDTLLTGIFGSYKYVFPAGYNHSYEFGAEARAGLGKNSALNFRAVRYPMSWDYAAGAMVYF